MKLIIIEGLKGSGKSTAIKRIQQEHAIEVLEKFTKHARPIPDFLTEFCEPFKRRFNEVSSSLAVRFYANFFSELKKHARDLKTIIDRGIVSLPYSGLYGYQHNHEFIPFDQYKEIAQRLYDCAIKHYNTLDIETVCIRLSCSDNELRKRIGIRTPLIPSEKFFLENLNTYREWESEFYDKAQHTSKNATFYTIKNETKEDAELVHSLLTEIILGI